MLNGIPSCVLSPLCLPHANEKRTLLRPPSTKRFQQVVDAESIAVGDGGQRIVGLAWRANKNNSLSSKIYPWHASN